MASYTWTGTTSEAIDCCSNFNPAGVPTTGDTVELGGLGGGCFYPGSGSSDADWTIVSGGCIDNGTYNAGLVNAGTIKDGTFSDGASNTGHICGGAWGSLSNCNDGTIWSGTFGSGTVTTKPGGKVCGGTFCCTNVNCGCIFAGTFCAIVENHCYICGGTESGGVDNCSGGIIFDATVTTSLCNRSGATICGGSFTFVAAWVNVGEICGGTFDVTCTTNCGTIFAGTHSCPTFNCNCICGGTFNSDLTNCAAGKIGPTTGLTYTLGGDFVNFGTVCEMVVICAGAITNCSTGVISGATLDNALGTINNYGCITCGDLTGQYATVIATTFCNRSTGCLLGNGTSMTYNISTNLINAGLICAGDFFFNGTTIINCSGGVINGGYFCDLDNKSGGKVGGGTFTAATCSTNTGCFCNAGGTQPEICGVCFINCATGIINAASICAPMLNLGTLNDGSSACDVVNCAIIPATSTWCVVQGAMTNYSTICGGNFCTGTTLCNDGNLGGGKFYNGTFEGCFVNINAGILYGGLFTSNSYISNCTGGVICGGESSGQLCIIDGAVCNFNYSNSASMLLCGGTIYGGCFCGSIYATGGIICGGCFVGCGNGGNTLTSVCICGGLFLTIDFCPYVLCNSGIVDATFCASLYLCDVTACVQGGTFFEAISVFQGGIAGGTLCGFVDNIGGYLSGGTYHACVWNYGGAYISAGTFCAGAINGDNWSGMPATINGGDFYGAVSNNAYSYFCSGTFFGTVDSVGCVVAGVFCGTLIVNGGYIGDGSTCPTIKGTLCLTGSYICYICACALELRFAYLSDSAMLSKERGINGSSILGMV